MARAINRISLLATPFSIELITPFSSAIHTDIHPSTHPSTNTTSSSSTSTSINQSINPSSSIS
jgi:hypothetical protein